MGNDVEPNKSLKSLQSKTCEKQECNLSWFASVNNWSAMRWIVVFANGLMGFILSAITASPGIDWGSICKLFWVHKFLHSDLVSQGQLTQAWSSVSNENIALCCKHITLCTIRHKPSMNIAMKEINVTCE